MARISALVFAGMSLVILSAQAQDQKKNDADKKALQGSWTAMKGDRTAKITFEKDKFELDFDGKKVTGTYALDASQAPKHIDLNVKTVSDEDAKKFEGKTSKAIYELEANRFKWLAPQPGNDDRPNAFPQDGEQAKGLYLTFERDKK
jgi:uncharacterized protein (TIGR03067 family)